LWPGRSRFFKDRSAIGYRPMASWPRWHISAALTLRFFSRKCFIYRSTDRQHLAASSNLRAMHSTENLSLIWGDLNVGLEALRVIQTTVLFHIIA
jgi:hypothetical protein